MISEAMNIPLTLPPASNPRQMDMPPRTGGDFIMPPRRPDGAVPISGIRPNVPLGSSQRTTFMGSYPLGRSVDMADVCSRLMDSGEQSDRSLQSSAVLCACLQTTCIFFHTHPLSRSSLCRCASRFCCSITEALLLASRL